MTQSTILTTTKQSNLRPFKPGQSGNPKGSPKGSKHKLSERFVADLLLDFEKHGPATIKRFRERDPAAYIRIIASLVPKEFDIGGEVAISRKLHNMTDDELMAIIEGTAVTIASEVDGSD